MELKNDEVRGVLHKVCICFGRRKTAVGLRELRHVKSNHQGTDAPSKNLTMNNLTYSQRRVVLEGRNGIYHGGEEKDYRAVCPRYRKANKAGKTRILDEYLELAGGNRKYAIFKLGRVGKKQTRKINGKWVNVEITDKTRKKRVYKPYYDGETAEKLTLLWENFSWPCGKLFAPLPQGEPGYYPA
jgi:hypothetical protein